MYIKRGKQKRKKAKQRKEKKPIRAITQILRGVVKTQSKLPARIVLLFPARIYRRHKPKPQGKKRQRTNEEIHLQQERGEREEAECEETFDLTAF